MPAVTKEEVKSYAGITSVNQDALIDSLIPSSLMAIGSYCGRNFSYRSQTEYRDGNNSVRMILVNHPIVAFISLSIDGTLLPVSTNGSSGYIARPGTKIVQLVGYKFNEGIRNVEMSFTCGYGDSGNVNPWPDDLKNALIMYVVTRLKERDSLGVGSQSLGGQSVSYSTAASGTSAGSEGIPSAARLVLNGYKSFIPEHGR